MHPVVTSIQLPKRCLLRSLCLLLNDSESCDISTEKVEQEEEQKDEQVEEQRVEQKVEQKVDQEVEEEVDQEGQQEVELFQNEKGVATERRDNFLVGQSCFWQVAQRRMEGTDSLYLPSFM